MAFLKSSLLVLATILYFVEDVRAAGKVVCFYNSNAYERKDLAKVTIDDIKPALPLCTHLVYTYIGIDKDDYKVKSLNKKVDTDKDKGANLFQAVNNLKKEYPALKVSVSIGGYVDQDTPEKYLKLLEKTNRRADFVNSVVNLVNQYNFDGIDLAWQFPIVKENVTRSVLGSVWHSIKKAFSFSTKDDHEKEHKEQFTALVRELGAALRGYKKILTLSALPHVNKKAYFDGPGIKEFVDHIHLLTYDFRNPDRTEELADYAAPLYFIPNRVAEQNVEDIVQWWLSQQIPAQKLIIAIPTHGRTWKLTKDSGTSGVPPVKADGPGEAGPYLKEEGTMAYYEICPLLVTAGGSTASTLLKKVPDPQSRSGTYAYRLPASKVKGLWVSYEDPEVAGKKAYYAKSKGLAGVAIVDLSLDDFRGSCDATRTKFPILVKAKLNL